MSGRRKAGDLFVLVADQDMEQTVRGLLGRHKSLGIAPIEFEVRRHPRRDSGCRSGAADYLRAFLDSYLHALVIFDLDGSGSHATREETQQEVEDLLCRNGWDGRAKAVVIEPELETWVWSISNKVPKILGCNTNYTDLRRWLHLEGLWPDDSDKPPDPKEAMKRVMRASRSRRSPRRFFELANAVSLRGCRDPSFDHLKTILHLWFPPGRER